MKSILSFLFILSISFASAQSVPGCFKKPDGELKVLFVSTYKIKAQRYQYGEATPVGKEAGDFKGTTHEIDKSMKDDNTLLLQEWYKLVKERLERMGVTTPDYFDYVDLTDQAAGMESMGKVLTGANQWIMITCNDLSKAQKDYKKGQLTLESFKRVAISIQCAKEGGSPYVKNNMKGLASMLDRVEKDM